ncbi:methionine aminopeptidase 2-like protein [Erysiphe pulchra]|uniref:Methionine aminopeptidase 2 n=1 Tax=Erysiphe pulchra TaxID=225359 RepID=A0A2S4Q1B2_9PEZI|nr:methionine aminopeptidase 2-like protein [Erysiphe pulchra]
MAKVSISLENLKSEGPIKSLHDRETDVGLAIIEDNAKIKNSDLRQENLTYGETSKDNSNEDANEVRTGNESADKSTKKKRKRKKKPKNDLITESRQQESDPIPLASLFKGRLYPVGQEVEYRDQNLYRTTNEEKRYLDNMNHEFLQDYRHGAEIHRRAREWAQKNIIPGRSLIEVAEGIEDTVRGLSGHPGLEEGDNMKGGIAFPTGINVDHIAAHYSPNTGNSTLLTKDNVVTVDFGVHINGRIVDSAYTLTFDPTYNELLEAVRQGTDTGIREAGIDARLGEIGEAIQETLESFECTIKGKTYPIKSIRNMNGHDIRRWQIHGGKSVPIVKSNDQTKMEEGEVYAIETYGSTGNGFVREDYETSHYAKAVNGSKNVALRIQSASKLLNVINKNFGTLPFCKRYLDRLGLEKYSLGLNALVSNGIVEAYPPLVDKKGSFTAQFEHTILLRPNIKEVISRGDDY